MREVRWYRELFTAAFMNVTENNMRDWKTIEIGREWYFHHVDLRISINIMSAEAFNHTLYKGTEKRWHECESV